MLAAVVSTTAGTLPVFLLGGLAVLLREELGFGEARLGALVTAFFLASAVCSVPAGRIAGRYGAGRTTTAGAVLSAAALLAVAGLARSWAGLLGCLVVAGAGNALAQIGSNAGLARDVPPARQGFAFGVKQAAIPVATLLAGVAVPAVGLTVGWRWAFVAAAGLAAGYLLVVPRGLDPDRAGRPGRRRRAERRREGDAATSALLVVAAGAGLGAAADNALGAFLVESAVADGLGPGAAGLLLALGSAVNIAARLAAGLLADRRDGGHLPVVATMLALGAVGLVLLAVGGLPALVVGTVLGFGLGWSWPGLLTFAVVRLNPGAPAAATSITQTGVFVGGAVGPLGFGLLLSQASYAVAWLAAAACLLLGAGLVLLGRRRLIADLAQRGTARVSPVAVGT